MLQEYRNKKIERVRIFEGRRSEKKKNNGRQPQKQRFSKGRNKKEDIQEIKQRKT